MKIMRNYITLDVKNKNSELVLSLLSDLGVNSAKLFVDIDCSMVVDINDLVRIKTKKLYIKRLFNDSYILVATMDALGECRLTLNYLNYLYNSNSVNKTIQSVENISNFDVSNVKSLPKFTNYMNNIIGIDLSSIYNHVTPKEDANLDWVILFSTGKLNFSNIYTERVTMFDKVFYLLVAIKELDGIIRMNSYFIESFTYLSRLDSFRGGEYPYDIVKNETLKTQPVNNLVDSKLDFSTDDILEKISASGIDSLSDDERLFLNNL